MNYGKAKSLGSLFIEILSKNCPSLSQYMVIQIQEAGPLKKEAKINKFLTRIMNKRKKKSKSENKRSYN